MDGRPPGPSRVLIADDHAGFLDVARRLIDADPGLQTVAEARTGEQACEMARDLDVDLVIMDVYMPGMGGIEAARAIAATDSGTTVVLASTCPFEELAAAARRCNASGVISKQDLRRSTVEWLRTIARSG